MSWSGGKDSAIALHELLQTHGDAAVRRAFERGLAEQAIGAGCVAHYLGDSCAS